MTRRNFCRAEIAATEIAKKCIIKCTRTVCGCMWSRVNIKNHRRFHRNVNVSVVRFATQLLWGAGTSPTSYQVGFGQAAPLARSPTDGRASQVSSNAPNAHSLTHMFLLANPAHYERARTATCEYVRRRRYDKEGRIATGQSARPSTHSRFILRTHKLGWTNLTDRC